MNLTRFCIETGPSQTQLKFHRSNCVRISRALANPDMNDDSEFSDIG